MGTMKVPRTRGGEKKRGGRYLLSMQKGRECVILTKEDIGKDMKERSLSPRKSLAASILEEKEKREAVESHHLPLRRKRRISRSSRTYRSCPSKREEGEERKKNSKKKKKPNVV